MTAILGIIGNMLTCVVLRRISLDNVFNQVIFKILFESRIPSSACRPLEHMELDFAAVQSPVDGAPRWIVIFDGCRRLAHLVAAEAGRSLRVLAGIDARQYSYGQRWNLCRPEDRARLRFLFFEVLKPAGAHFALPCAPWSALGNHQPGAEAFAVVAFTVDGLGHLDSAARAWLARVHQ